MSFRVTRSLLSTLTVALVVSSTAAELPPIEVKINDLTPKFLKFYEAAQQENASPDRRWELWKEMYDFAAVPPTPEGEKIARDLLDKAWPRYGGVQEILRGGAANLKPDPEAAVRSIAELLKPEQPVNITVRVYVGAFDENAFTAANSKGVITTSLPLEIGTEPRARLMMHELTHAVHIAMGTFSGGWIRTVGATVVSEGLATRTAHKLSPGEPEAAFVEYTPGWLAAANAKRTEILKSIVPALESDKSEDVMRFTMGTGPNGIEREAYYVGWLVVGHWLDTGMTLAEVARIPEKEMPKRAAEAIKQMLAGR